MLASESSQSHIHHIQLQSPHMEDPCCVPFSRAQAVFVEAQHNTHNNPNHKLLLATVRHKTHSALHLSWCCKTHFIDKTT